MPEMGKTKDFFEKLLPTLAINQRCLTKFGITNLREFFIVGTIDKFVIQKCFQMQENMAKNIVKTCQKTHQQIQMADGSYLYSWCLKAEVQNRDWLNSSLLLNKWVV